jgi:hypothetical protein
VVDWPMAVEIVPDRGDPFVGAVQAAVVLEGWDVDRLLAGLRRPPAVISVKADRGDRSNDR